MLNINVMNIIGGGDLLPKLVIQFEDDVVEFCLNEYLQKMTIKNPHALDIEHLGGFLAGYVLVHVGDMKLMGRMQGNQEVELLTMNQILWAIRPMLTNARVRREDLLTEELIFATKYLGLTAFYSYSYYADSHVHQIELSEFGEDHKMTNVFDYVWSEEHTINADVNPHRATFVETYRKTQRNRKLKELWDCITDAVKLTPREGIPNMSDDDNVAILHISGIPKAEVAVPGDIIATVKYWNACNKDIADIDYEISDADDVTEMIITIKFKEKL